MHIFIKVAHCLTNIYLLATNTFDIERVSKIEFPLPYWKNK